MGAECGEQQRARLAQEVGPHGWLLIHQRTFPSFAVVIAAQKYERRPPRRPTSVVAQWNEPPKLLKFQKGHRM
jgi:hypothetical protein